MMTVFRVILLIGLVGCAIATAIVRKPMRYYGSRWRRRTWP